MQPHSWSLLWPSEHQPEMRLRLTIFPERLGAELGWERYRADRELGGAYWEWLRLRIGGEVVPSSDVFEEICEVLAEPPPSREALGVPSLKSQ